MKLGRFCMSAVDRLQIPYFLSRVFPGSTFSFGGKVFEYFFSKVNMTWRTERIVEIPLATEFIGDDWGFLEVGDVLCQYGFRTHFVVDLFSKRLGVQNKDIVTYDSIHFYDKIVCISTLEHIDDFVGALKNMESLLNWNGCLFVTVPVGWNRELDLYLIENYLCRFMKRTGKCSWVETDSVDGIVYDSPFIAGNGLIIVEVCRG